MLFQKILCHDKNRKKLKDKKHFKKTVSKWKVKEENSTHTTAWLKSCRQHIDWAFAVCTAARIFRFTDILSNGQYTIVTSTEEIFRVSWIVHLFICSSLFFKFFSFSFISFFHSVHFSRVSLSKLLPFQFDFSWRLHFPLFSSFLTFFYQLKYFTTSLGKYYLFVVLIFVHILCSWFLSFAYFMSAIKKLWDIGHNCVPFFFHFPLRFSSSAGIRANDTHRFKCRRLYQLMTSDDCSSAKTQRWCDYVSRRCDFCSFYSNVAYGGRHATRPFYWM